MNPSAKNAAHRSLATTGRVTIVGGPTLSEGPHGPTRRGSIGQSIGLAERAVTRLEVCLVLAAVTLLFAVAGTALTMNGTRADRLVCLSNLSEIGKGYNRWALEHDDRYPFHLRGDEGGIRSHYNGLEVNAWFQYAWLSNELRTPRILACPSDIRRPANDFSTGPNGLLNPTRRNNAISYFVSHPTAAYGHSTLAGDRHVTFTELAGCSYFNQAALIGLQTSHWTTALHPDSGNLLYRDGSVEEVNSAGLRRAFANDESSDGYHVLLP